MHPQLPYLDKPQTLAALADGRFDDLPHWQRPVSAWLMELWEAWELRSLDLFCDKLIKGGEVSGEYRAGLSAMAFDASGEARRTRPLRAGYVAFDPVIALAAFEKGAKLEVYQGDSILPRASDDPNRFCRVIKLPDGVGYAAGPEKKFRVDCRGVPLAAFRKNLHLNNCKK